MNEKEPCTLKVFYKDGYTATIKNVKSYGYKDNHLIVCGTHYNIIPSLTIAMIKELKTGEVDEDND